jgi:hypothetical protein
MRALAWLFVPSLLVTATRASAQSVDEQPPLGILPTHDRLIDPTMARSWAVAPARPFAATTIDVGWVYARPRLSLGYGKPFTSWVGVDINPLVLGAGVGAYGGVRFALPWIDLRVGSRYFLSFQRFYLPAQDSYSRVDLDSDVNPAAQTITHEAELTANIPVGPGDVLLLGSASIVTGVPEGQYVFEETLHVIVKPPYVWRARTGYSLRFGSANQHSVGLVVEALDVPRRDDSLTLRAGPVVRIVLSRRVEVRGSFVATIVSPDRIGLVGGDFTELGVRYRWATEKCRPSGARVRRRGARDRARAS